MFILDKPMVALYGTWLIATCSLGAKHKSHINVNNINVYYHFGICLIAACLIIHRKAHQVEHQIYNSL